MSDTYIIGAILVSMALLILMITKLKVNAFIALLICALGLSLATGNSGGDSVEMVMAGFGDTMAGAGIIIVLGVIVGSILEKTGGAEKIAASVLGFVGEKNAVLATCITAGIVSIPVFDDSGFLILYPVVKSLSKKGKIPLFTLVTSLCLCLLTTHCLVPPTPGPIAAAAILGADLGKVILYGLFVSIFSIIGLYFYANSKRKKYPAYVTEDVFAETVREDELFKDGRPHTSYSTGMAYIPILLPILLIVCNSVFGQLLPETHPVNVAFGFIGKPMIALLIGVGALWVMTRNYRTDVRLSWIDQAMDSTALVMLITAAGGAYGAVIKSTGIGGILSGVLAGTQVPSILLPFLIAFFVGTATGSATVSLSTTAAITAPLVASLGISPELAVIAAASGACGIVNVNASCFWLVQRICKWDMKETAECYSVGSLVLVLCALAGTFILSLFVH